MKTLPGHPKPLKVSVKYKGVGNARLTTLYYRFLGVRFLLSYSFAT